LVPTAYKNIPKYFYSTLEESCLTVEWPNSGVLTVAWKLMM